MEPATPSSDSVRAALSEIASRQHRIFIAMAVRRYRVSRHVAEDLVQAAYLRTLRRAELLADLPREAIAAGLVTTIHHLALHEKERVSFERSRPRVVSDETLSLLAEGLPGPADPVDEIGAGELVRMATTLEPSRARAVLLAAAGFSPVEIAERLGVSEYASRHLVSRGRRDLRRRALAA